jgi:ABC-type polysaccharide/polyol phosphate export permease
LISATEIKSFVATVCRERSAIVELSRRSFLAKNRGAYLGFVWTYAEPLLFILILWGVFRMGFRHHAVEEIPFFPWLACGLVPWFFFSETATGMTGVIRQHAYLVKNVRFPVSILPIALLLSAVVPHFVLLCITLLILFTYSLVPDLHLLQLLYYFCAMCLFLIGFGWLTSSTSLFVQDVGNITRVLIRFGFWLTPIIWKSTMIPSGYRWLLKLNPMVYIVTGYRDSLLYGIPFWAKPVESVCFWSITFLMLLAGTTAFKRLKPHFAEVV